MRRSHVIIFSSLALVLVAAIIGYQSRYYIYDHVETFNYSPPQEVDQLANQTTMTSYGRELFYAYHPQIEDSAQFNQNCNVSQQVIVLGCTVVDKGIYLYNVTQSELNGIEQVTAAYEMLHVGYDQMSGSERKYIDGLVMSAYNSLITTDPSLKQQEETYLKTEGQGAVLNELHSTLATQIASLPTPLENYYKRYFNNRQAIVGYFNQYQSEFTTRQSEVDQDDQQLSTWQSQINSDEAQLNTENTQINQEAAELNAEKARGEIPAYNAGVPGYNNDVNSYNNLVNQTRSLITQYNQLVIARNQIALQENNLIQSINSLPNTLTTK